MRTLLFDDFGKFGKTANLWPIVYLFPKKAGGFVFIFVFVFVCLFCFVLFFFFLITLEIFQKDDERNTSKESIAVLSLVTGNLWTLFMTTLEISKKDERLMSIKAIVCQ